MEKKLALTPDKNNLPVFEGTAPALGSLAKVPSADPTAAGMVDEQILSPEEIERVEQFAREIDMMNPDQIISYGASAQRDISDFSVNILKKVKTLDLGEIGNSLRELTAALDATTEPEKKGIFRLFQRGKRTVQSISANYAKAETNVDRVEQDLRSHQIVLTQDMAMYQQMYELNLEYYKELTMYIVAGKKALALARSRKLQALRARAEATDRQEDVQMYRDFEDQCIRFEKKLSDLEVTRMIAMQSAPQVRMLQNNDREMLNKIQSSLANTIPLWRHQLVISLGLEHSRRAAEAQRLLSDKTNELLLKNAESLRTSAAETAKEAERPIVDMETLRRCNQELIASINDVVKIHEQGTLQRQKAHEELTKIEQELKQALLDAGSR